MKAAARRDGLTPEQIERDIGILRTVAYGSITAAMGKFRIGRTTVWAVLERYGGYADGVLKSMTK